MISKIDATRWRETWHQELSMGNKLLYDYIWDHADGAGGWKIDMGEVSRGIGLPVNSMTPLIDAGVAKILVIGGEEYLWLKRYCLQHKTMSDRYEGQRAIIRMIRFYGLFGEPEIKSLFRDGYQYTVDRERTKLKLDVVDKEQPGERDMFNTMTDKGIPLTWKEWRSLCQLCPKMDKKQVLESIMFIIPDYMSSFIRLKGNTKRAQNGHINLWKMVVDIAEYSEKKIEYTGAMAESLKSIWRSAKSAKCRSKIKPIPPL